jgi:hypothetical protein
MEPVNVYSWEEFESRLQELRRDGAAGRPGDLLFRGLSDSTWPLTTTLERNNWVSVPVSGYYGLISRIHPQIQSLTKNEWKISPYPDVVKLLETYDAWALHRFPDPDTYSYMVYLRHHGFPSPLLDWTRSARIAAFFAFRSTIEPKDGHVSIYAFSEMPKGTKLTSNDSAWIRRIGPFVTTHRRHFLQQSDYTMCATFSDEWRFVSHDEATVRDDQDVLWKFNLPWSERIKVLKILDEYNLNAFSLFESEESLMETLAVREMEFKETERVA